MWGERKAWWKKANTSTLANIKEHTPGFAPAADVIKVILEMKGMLMVEKHFVSSAKAGLLKTEQKVEGHWYR